MKAWSSYYLVAVLGLACTSDPPAKNPGKPLGSNCGVSSECASGLLCLEGLCSEGCRSASDCRGSPPGGCATWACVSGDCLSACEVNDGGPLPDAEPTADASPGDVIVLERDASLRDFGVFDVGLLDATVFPDASPPQDSGTLDATTPADAETTPDATTTPDSGTFLDATTPVPDAGIVCDPTPRTPQPGDLVINEILADPATGAGGDANADGTRDSGDDEFVEIGNRSSATIDLTGVVVADATSIRHTFGTQTLACGKVIVVFGGGNDTGAGWRANWLKASTGALSLNNTSDSVRLGSTAAAIGDLATQTFGSEADGDQSIVRQIELDPASAMVRHQTIAAGRAYSPGTRVDGAEF